MIDFTYTVIRTNRKSIELSVAPHRGEVIVRCNKLTPASQIESMLEHKADHIRKSLAQYKQKPQPIIRSLSADEIAQLKLDAKAYIPSRVEYHSVIMNVRPDKVKITSAQKRWGCCIIRNRHHYNICFSYRIMLLPEELRDLIIIHELAHMIEPRHTAFFYAVLDLYSPDHYHLSELLRQQEKTLPVPEKK
jgi:predicted metal-dependent hydrolase